ncbi:MAG TPA: hypothetical protein VLS93_13495 [Anaeromyxobacteraceae bacterium]|nr:hypothetical protein [Anaeromyxobacteraceae bacterium]
MRRLVLPVVLVLALGCGGSDGPPPPPRDPWVAGPAPTGVAGNAAFLQGVASVDPEPFPDAFPGSANLWDLAADFSLFDGWDDQFDGGLALFVGTLATTPPTLASLAGEVYLPSGLEGFPSDQAFAELSFHEPVYAAADLLLAAASDGSDLFPLTVPVAGTRSAFLAPTGDSRLGQVVDLTSASDAAILAWSDQVYLYGGLVTGGIGAAYRVVLRDPDTGALLATARESLVGAGGDHSFSLAPFVGRPVLLSFEFRSAGLYYARIDAVSVVDVAAPEPIVNGGFENGLAGWTPSTGGQSQNLVSGTRTLAGLQVTRGFFAAPGSHWARWVDVFDNPGSAAVTRDVVYHSVLGSAGCGVVYQPQGAAGRAVASWDACATQTGDLGIVFGSGSAHFLSNDTLGSPNGSPDVFVVHPLTVPAGGKAALVHFVLIDGHDTGRTATGVSSRATAIDEQAAAIASGFWSDPVYRDWMTAEQSSATIANW